MCSKFFSSVTCPSFDKIYHEKQNHILIIYIFTIVNRHPASPWLLPEMIYCMPSSDYAFPGMWQQQCCSAYKHLINKKRSILWLKIYFRIPFILFSQLSRSLFRRKEAREWSFICRGVCVNYSSANTWEMCSPGISFWSDTRGLHSKGTAESDRGVCTIQAALSQASLGMPEVQNNRPSSNFTLRMVKSSSHSGMHRCRHSAAVNPSKHSLCLILCGVNATDGLPWACVCCIWVSHSKWRSPLSCCFFPLWCCNILLE